MSDPLDTDRRALGAAQTALLKALVHGESLPDGFDPERAKETAAVLARKRKRRPGVHGEGT